MTFPETSQKKCKQVVKWNTKEGVDTCSLMVSFNKPNSNKKKPKQLYIVIKLI